MSCITTARVGGLGLILGSALYILSTLLMPGFLFEQAEPNDLNSVVDAIAAQPLLTDIASLMGGVAVMFMLWGLIVMWQTAGSNCALDTFVKFGVASLMVTAVSLLFAQFLTYLTSHVLEHGIGAGIGPDQMETLQATGRYLQAMAGVARLMAALAGLMGYVVLGFALARKLKPGFNKTLSFIVGVGGIVGLIIMAITEQAHDFVDALAPLTTALSILFLLWWIVIGIGVYQEHPRLKIGEVYEH